MAGSKKLGRAVVLAAVAVLVWGVVVQAGVAANGKRRASVEIVGFRVAGGKLVEPGGTLRACRKNWVAAYVAFRNVRQGALVIRRWRHGGKLVKGASEVWDRGRKRRVVRFQIFNPLSVPEGRYRIAVKVAGTKWRVATVRLTC